jgi:hypothetical protein
MWEILGSLAQHHNKELEKDPTHASVLETSSASFSVQLWLSRCIILGTHA